MQPAKVQITEAIKALGYLQLWEMLAKTEPDTYDCRSGEMNYMQPYAFAAKKYSCSYILNALWGVLDVFNAGKSTDMGVALRQQGLKLTPMGLFCLSHSHYRPDWKTNRGPYQRTYEIPEWQEQTGCMRLLGSNQIKKVWASVGPATKAKYLAYARHQLVQIHVQELKNAR